MMRAWGRNTDGTWVAVTTDDSGDNSYVYIVNLIQVLKLSLNESPFFANYGIPAQQSVITQIFPDYFVWATQAQFAKYFAALIITKLPRSTPTYRIDLTTKAGVQRYYDVDAGGGIPQ